MCTSPHFLPATVIKCPEETGLMGERAYCSSQFQDTAHHFGEIRWCTVKSKERMDTHMPGMHTCPVLACLLHSYTSQDPSQGNGTTHSGRVPLLYYCSQDSLPETCALASLIQTASTEAFFPVEATRCQVDKGTTVSSGLEVDFEAVILRLREGGGRGSLRV